MTDDTDTDDEPETFTAYYCGVCGGTDADDPIGATNREVVEGHVEAYHPDADVDDAIDREELESQPQSEPDAERILEHIDENPDTVYVRFWLEGRFEKEDLDYGDWMSALRWGDVAVAIAAEWAAFFEDLEPEDARTYYRLVDGGDLVEQWPADDHGRATMSHHHFAETLRAHYDRVELVPLEASPFGGDGG